MGNTNPQSGRELKSVNLSCIVYPYLSAFVGKLFEVSIYFSFSPFFFIPFALTFSKLSFVTTSAVLVPVSWYYVTSINYEGKKARVGIVSPIYPFLEKAPLIAVIFFFAFSLLFFLLLFSFLNGLIFWK